MIERRKPLDVVAHERLFVRLPEYHGEFDFVKEKLYQLESGFAGECKVDELLREIPFSGEVHVAGDISFEWLPNRYLQIDTLIVTQKAIFVLEVKNYAAGKVDFDDHSGKTVHTTERQVKRYDCVVDQMDRIGLGLRGILRELRVELPVIPIIVMANGASIVEGHPKAVAVKYAKQLPRYIRSVLEQLPEVKSVRVADVYRKLVDRSHKRQPYPLCQRYKIPYYELRKGVVCGECGRVLKRGHGRLWKCPVCKIAQTAAVDQALKDWFYLVDHRITNRQAREWLGVDNARRVSYLLKQSNLKKIGNYRHAYYAYSEDSLE